MRIKLKPLPIGIQTFEEIISEAYTYVDKTQSIYDLVTGGKVYFFSRPRRFGKSLLISTLEALFQNRRDLFKGLWIDSSDYHWQQHPVIRIDMTLTDKSSAENLRKSLLHIIKNIAEKEKLEINTDILSSAFSDLIVLLAEKYDQKVAVLIDEYDKPILDNISKPQLVKETRDVLRDFYSILKAQDEYLKFVFLTGVSKFAKVSIFSGLNNLKDISMDDRFASLCGYTQKELELNFKEYIDLYTEFNSGYKFVNRDELLQTIKEWYNGYRFTGAETKVYNPFSTLLLFDTKQFTSHWFATGTPKFLLDVIESEKYYELDRFEKLSVRANSLDDFDVDNFHVPSILYQAGYLTIMEQKDDGFVLNYPNKEVRQALVEVLLDRFSRLRPEDNYSYLNNLIEALKERGVEDFIQILKAYFAEIPYDIHIPLEKYYQSMIYAVCRLISEKVNAEVRTNIGRIDMLMELKDSVYIFEFKINQSADSALKQIHEKKYYEKYSHLGKAIKLIGVGFSSEERNITEFKIEDYVKG